MKKFLQQLDGLNSSADGRRVLYVPYDQLSDQIGPLARENPRELAIVLIENPRKASRRPYHRQKLVWILCQQRQFGLEQAARGVAVLYRVGDYGEVLQSYRARVMRPAERELRGELEPLFQSGALEELPHEGWLTRADDMPAGPPWRMDAFYRRVRQRLGILMEKGKPIGGRYSFDGENRHPWKGDPPAPRPPRFEETPLKREVRELIQTHYAHHPGEFDLSTIPVTSEEIELYWRWVQAECLPWFGPYEDAMSVHSPHLFHSRLSPLINLHRLTPRRVLQDVLELDLPLNCKEGFVRQLLGWREYMHHCHEMTDGFRTVAPESTDVGDGGYSLWTGQAWSQATPAHEPCAAADRGAVPNVLGADRPLPPAFWGVPSGLNCLDTVIAQVWREGYSHHITRLMILSNLASLLDVSPRQLTDWFWVAYIDAYDWVVEPNVLGMGTFAAGPVLSTKPYVCGSAYIHRMSDFCKSCRFDPRSDCPVTSLYWAFLERKSKHLGGVGRVDPVLRGLANRSAEKKRHDAAVFERVSATLTRGEAIEPA